MDHYDLLTLEAEHRHPQILHSVRGAARSILVQLPAGEGLAEHKVHETTYVIVLDGEIELNAPDDAERLVTGTTGFMAVLLAAEPHEIRATRDTRLLLILAPWPGAGHPGVRDAPAEAIV